MSEHTPTPWTTDGTHVLDDRRQVVAVCRQARPRNTMEAIANAEFIVRACNAHAKLLAACKAHVSKGHNDTCQMLLTGDDCNCGRDLAVAAVHHAEAK